MILQKPEHHDYFFPARRIIEDTMKRYKHKLSLKLKLSETSIKNVEKYPILILKPLDNHNTDEKNQLCRVSLSAYTYHYHFILVEI